MSNTDEIQPICACCFIQNLILKSPFVLPAFRVRACGANTAQWCVWRTSRRICATHRHLPTKLPRLSGGRQTETIPWKSRRYSCKFRVLSLTLLSCSIAFCSHIEHCFYSPVMLYCSGRLGLGLNHYAKCLCKKQSVMKSTIRSMFLLKHLATCHNMLFVWISTPHF